MGIRLNINLDEFEKWLTPERFETAFYNGGFDVEVKDEYKEMNMVQVETEPIPEREIRFNPNGITTVFFSTDSNLQQEIEDFQRILSVVKWTEIVKIIGFNEEKKSFSFKMESNLIGQVNCLFIGLYFLKKGLRMNVDKSEKFAHSTLKNMSKDVGVNYETI